MTNSFIRKNMLQRRIRNISLKFSKRDLLIVFLTLLAMIAFFCVAYKTRQVVTAQDGLSYIAISQNYHNGNFQEAINAYWSPFMSWLMIPFIAVGISGLSAFMAVNALAATSILLIGLFLIRKYVNNFFLLFLYIFTATPFLIHALVRNNPDILVVTWVMIFLVALIKADEWLLERTTKADIKTGIMLGLVGAIGYFVKLFILPVFIVSLFVWVFIRGMSELDSRKKKTTQILDFLRIPAITLIIMVIVSAPWVTAIYFKYDKFMLGSSFSHNFIKGRLQKSETANSGNKSVQPTITEIKPNKVFPQDPTTPPNNLQFSASENKPIKVNDYLDKRLKVMPLYINRIFSIGPLILLTMFCLGAAVLFGLIKYRKPKDKALITAGIIFGVYFAGYAAAVNPGDGGNVRYLWPLFLLSLIVIILSLPDLWASIKKQKAWQKTIFILLIFLLPLTTFQQYVLGVGYPYSINIKRGPVIDRSVQSDTIFDIFDKGKKISPRQKLAIQIKEMNIIKPGNIIAGNNKRSVLYIAYFTQATGYSFNTNDKTTTEFYEALDEQDVDYFINYMTTPSDKIQTKQGDVIVNISKKRFTCGNERQSKKEVCSIQIIKLN